MIPLKICPEMFYQAKVYCDALDYKGPLALGCNDTKLLGALGLYYDRIKKAHFLVGGVDGSIRVIDPDQVDEMMNNSKVKKGTKVQTTHLF